jgi:hypothetical protein
MRFKVLVAALLVIGAWLAACRGGGSPPPPPPQRTKPSVPAQPGVPPGHVLVTVAASSTPPGAVVTGGGQMLGRTPFRVQVPIPAPRSGETQTFAFTFQLPGYQPATVTASPIHDTITLDVALAPLEGGNDAADPTTGPRGGGTVIRVRGPSGGAIYDMHTTTSVARVSEQCVIADLSVEIDGSHTFPSDLVVSLRSPDGESYTLQSHSSRNPFRRHSVRRAAGRFAAGTWTLSIADTVARDSGQLRGWSLTIRCR